MVKGVNKQIIEVNNPESIYFERAVFYLKPGVRILPTELSEREINKIIAPYIDGRKKAESLRKGRILLYSIILILTVLLIISITM
jgi:hypothetical protein